MRISTNQLYSRATGQINGLSMDANRLQTQIATNKRVEAPSDDATAWRRIQSLNRDDAIGKADAANVDLAQTLLGETDIALGSAETQLQRAQELAIQAATTTLNASDRAAIASELDGIVDELLSLANQSDVRGQPLFGGATGDTAFVKAADGSIAFAGSGEPAAIPFGNGDSVHATVSGERVFGSGSAGGGAFGALASLSAALQVGDVDAIGMASDAIGGALDTIGATRSSVGARAIRLDYTLERLDTAATTRAESRSALEEVDMTAAITELQKTLTVLDATQSSFSQLTSLSLFDYLR
ncbi:flagellar hook-associated protein FlgL [Stakelama tenebrarum]|uniref:Flagellar hook-associated protein 3 n=1 Tax=Stakelama tenebrarum TaxID=2711215 RepID=A0A6G6Y1C4_9SPHN|nr:flagellar hook-associated protein FlgL [Sphingosinithalassobacter tenebrarum]QIG78699.1 flagellar hook-associated protein 3 [Sphingosinithalassobacter tenebrarum]